MNQPNGAGRHVRTARARQSASLGRRRALRGAVAEAMGWSRSSSYGEEGGDHVGAVLMATVAGDLGACPGAVSGRCDDLGCGARSVCIPASVSLAPTAGVKGQAPEPSFAG